MLTPYFQDEQVTIYHGDCREILPALETESVDLVITSPPYNLQNNPHGKSLRAGHSNSTWQNTRLAKGYNSWTDNLNFDDYREWQQWVLKECWRLLTNQGAIYYNHKPRPTDRQLMMPTIFNPDLPLRQIIIWDNNGKVNYSPFHYAPTCEWILLFAKREFQLVNRSVSKYGDVWRIMPDIGSLHPAPFPLALPKRILATTNSNVILDPFMGSGTTLKAAKDLGRKAIGIELDERYCETAVARLAQQPLAFSEAI